MVYADFNYYFTEYRGQMPESEFWRLSRQASAYLDRVTFGRIDAETLTSAVMNRVRDACCAVADAYLLNEHGGGIASESNDGITVNYVAGITNSLTEAQRVKAAAALYLSGTGLLYRGVD